ALAAGVFAAAAVAVVTTSNGGTPPATKTAPIRPAPPQAVSQPAPGHADTADAKLVSLARSVAQSPALPGNATLVVHTNTVAGDATPFVGEDLYEDNGDYYYGAT